MKSNKKDLEDLDLAVVVVNAALCFDRCIKTAACAESNYLGC